MKNSKNKKTLISSNLIIEVYASFVYISRTCLSGRLEYNSGFVGLGGRGVRGSEQNM